LFLFILNID